MTWSYWSAKGLPGDPALRAAQETEWIELTQRESNLESLTGLTQGILRLQPGKVLPLHHHPPPFSETYFFVRGNGKVRLGTARQCDLSSSAELDSSFEDLQDVPIEPGLHVQIPADTLHGIHAGSEGCEFIWTFAAAKWSHIPYIYFDKQLPRDGLSMLAMW